MKPTKKLLIDQDAGIGDILFVQKIAKVYADHYEVEFPIKDSISWIKDYVPGTMTKGQCSGSYDAVLELCKADRIYRDHRIMESKYMLANVDMQDYMDYITINRNTKKERELFEAVSPQEPYRLVCPNYGTPDDRSRGMYVKKIPHSDTLSNVVLDIKEGYTLFDWLLVIENAEEIYTTDSAIMFLIEKYDCKAKKLVAYCRRSNSAEVDYLFKKPWEYIA